MWKGREKCLVIGCKSPHRSVHNIPTTEPLRTQWLQFIYAGNVPDPVGKSLHVCANHFTDDCFVNLGQYRSGFAAILKLNTGAIPTVREASGDCKLGAGAAGSFYRILPDVRHVASQTDPTEGISVAVQPKLETLPDPPGKRSVGTQLSKRTLQNHFRSTATQARVPSRDFGVCTLAFPLDSPLLLLQPTIVKRPSKRPRLSLSDEEEGPSECSPYMVVQVPDDSQ